MRHTSPDDYRRIDALERLSCRALEPVATLDHVARVALQHFKVPIALVSLLDDRRQAFVGRAGTALTGSPIEHSFCREALGSDDVLVVEDATRDPRFAGSTLVTGEPWIRFYAGAPLVMDDGQTIGTACILDQVPRTLNVGHVVVLRQLARIALSELKERADRLKVPPRRGSITF